MHISSVDGVKDRTREVFQRVVLVFVSVPTKEIAGSEQERDDRQGLPSHIRPTMVADGSLTMRMSTSGGVSRDGFEGAEVVSR